MNTSWEGPLAAHKKSGSVIRFLLVIVLRSLRCLYNIVWGPRAAIINIIIIGIINIIGIIIIIIIRIIVIIA